MKIYYKGWSYEKLKDGNWHVQGSTNGVNWIEMFFKGTIREVKQSIDNEIRDYKNNN